MTHAWSTLSRREHGGVEQSSLEASAPPRRQVAHLVPVLPFAVPCRLRPSGPDNSTALWSAADGPMVGAAATVVTPMVVMPLLTVKLRLVTVAIVTVSPTVYLEDDGTECDKKADADASKKYQSCPLWLVYDKSRMGRKWGEWAQMCKRKFGDSPAIKV